MERHNERLTYGRTCVYNLNYHIVWGTKCRNKVLTEQIEKDLKSLMHQIAEEKGFAIEHLEIGLDDVAFPKFPSYFRRSAIMTAIGIVSTYMSAIDNWVAG